jgi:NADH:ubiquinone oxidoreductase subunit 2 (subunit N)
MLASLAALAERRSAWRAWNGAAFSAMLAAVAVMMVDPSAYADVLIYLSGAAPAWALGAVALRHLLVSDTQPSLRYYRGHVHDKPAWATALFVGFLGLTGSPLAPTFLGEDLLLHHAAGDHLWTAATIGAAFVVNGITLARLVTRLCWGPKELAPAAAT